MVAFDTLSANHLPCYGYDRNTSPNLCAFAEENVFFENAYSNSHWTLPSDISLFTGLYPSKTNLISHSDKLDPKIRMFPQVIKDFGYKVFFNAPKDDIGFPWNGVYDRIQEDFYDQGNHDWEQSIDDFKESVGNGYKTFLYLHFYDNHSPFLIGDNEQIYEPKNSSFPKRPSDFSNDFLVTPYIVNLVVSDAQKNIESNRDWATKKDLSLGYLDQLKKAGNNYQKQYEIVEKMRQVGLLQSYTSGARKYKQISESRDKTDVLTLRALYDQTINIMDESKMPILTELIESSDFKDNTILVIYSEHGEEFMEHGHLTHDTIYNSNVRVPLVMYIPGIKNKNIKEPVQLADLSPTLYQMIGGKTDLKFDGKSLVGRILGFKKTNELILIDGGNFGVKAVVYGYWKMHMAWQGSEFYRPYELYNLKDDPGELNNILFGNKTIEETILKLYKKTIRS